MNLVHKTILSLFLLSASFLYAQTPGLNYQAVILNTETIEVPGTDITTNQIPLGLEEVVFRFTISNDTDLEYLEEQSVTTDANGMVSLTVGEGTPLRFRFSDIVWNGQAKYLNVEINIIKNNEGFTFLDSRKILYVPNPFHVPDSGITTIMLADYAVTSIKIADENVTTAKLANDAVDTAKILDETILAEDIASGAITTDELLDETITSADIADNAITTTKILNETITEAKLANDAVTTTKIVDATISTADIADNAITNAKIASGGADKVLVTDGTGAVEWIYKTSLSAAAVADGNSIEGSGTTADPFKVKNDGILVDMIADNAVTTDEIANNTITTADIATGGTDKVLVTDGSGAVAWIDKSSLSAAALADGISIEGAGTTANPFKVKDLGIVTTMIANANVTEEKLADDAVTTDKILNATILAEDIASPGMKKYW
ncbi:hypothetical protein [Polaribacter sp. HL-MS24]|uniref:hypothetical protein n=1 Tax=Polaribacter sp. HL-MS24 TaxID=3077735 RepID=UPI002934E7E0|nr:hypothetical protein [Polaribacter sp. HL-MS24]WOC39344.1 hypothetical protein RRF69_06515 [Polaribacter sp. HL-MS24]